MTELMVNLQNAKNEEAFLSAELRKHEAFSDEWKGVAKRKMKVMALRIHLQDAVDAEMLAAHGY